MDLLKQSSSWDDDCSRSTLQKISMAFLTIVGSNWFLFFCSETIFGAFYDFESHVMIYLPIWLVNFTSDSQWKGRKSQGRTDLANSGEFDRRYLTCQISAILYADRGDRCIKSPGVSPALGRPWRWASLELFGKSELAIPSGKIRCKVSCNSFSFWRRGWKCLGGRSHIFADRLLSTCVYLEVLFHFFFLIMNLSWVKCNRNNCPIMYLKLSGIFSKVSYRKKKLTAHWIKL